MDKNEESEVQGMMPDDVRKAVEAEEARKEAKASGEVAPQNVNDFLKTLVQSYEQVQLPSRGLLYGDVLPDGVVNVRPMTMKEEKLLATPRLVRTGKAIDMIFESCVRENLEASKLLSVDRTFLLIWLRGISYGNEYDVQIKCPSCGSSFPETVDLSELPINYAPDGIAEPFSDVFPRCGQKFLYRLSRGEDEAAVNRHRERMARSYGDEGIDDTIIVRDRMLVESIAGFSEKADIESILENLSMEDATYLRQLFRDTGFGVDTSLPMVCAFCQHDFDVELPIDANFFFPQKTKKRA